MSNSILPPTQPCLSCPYRRDVPSGIWARDEYEKLAAYDRETWAQPPHVFMCHQNNGHMCAGWTAVHDMRGSMGFRVACSRGDIEERHIDQIVDYATKVPLFRSGAEAAKHGMKHLRRPTKKALAMIRKIARRRGIIR